MLFSQKLDWFLLSNDGLLDGIINEICSDIENNRTSYKGVNDNIRKKGK